MLNNQVKTLHKSTQLLISVTSIEEAKIALDNGADIIDLKNPHAGALGALPIALVQSITQFVQQYSPNTITSATIGDVPMQPQLLQAHVVEMAKTNVGFIKVGFFEADDYQHCLDALQFLTQKGFKLIAVLFAEYTYPKTLISALKQAGFVGIMLDTANKNGHTLLDYYSKESLQFFTQEVRNLALLLGFAGSLKSQHIVNFKHLAPNYLGFRGGVCENNQRTQQLNAEKVGMLKSTLKN